MEKLETSHCAGGKKNGALTLENNLAILQNVKHNYHMIHQLYS